TISRRSSSRFPSTRRVSTSSGSSSPGTSTAGSTGVREPRSDSRDPYAVNVELPYGETTLTGTLPARTRVLSNTEVITPGPLDDLPAAVGQALAQPLGLPRLGAMVKPGARVTIAFDDATVPSYGPIRSIAIEAVLAELAAAGVGLSTYDSIRVTHTPDGMSMSVHGNRMHAVLDEMGRHLEGRLGRRVFKIDTLGTDPFTVAKVVAGAVADARGAIVTAMAAMFPPRRDQARERFDVVVYGVPDSSPYAVFSHVNPILTLISSG